MKRLSLNSILSPVLIVLMLTLLFAGCSDRATSPDDPDLNIGKLNFPCAEDGKCDEGLVCEENICKEPVPPPPPPKPPLDPGDVGDPCSETQPCKEGLTCFLGICIIKEDKGALNHPCKDDGTCNPGLICENDICVLEEPPPPPPPPPPPDPVTPGDLGDPCSDDLPCKEELICESGVCSEEEEEETTTYIIPFIWPIPKNLPLPTFAESLGGTINDSTHAAAKTADGGFIVVGTTESNSTATSEMWVIRYDRDGNIVKQFMIKILEGTSDITSWGTAVDILKLDNGEHIILGSFDTPWGDRAVALIKLDTDSNLIWHKYYRSSGVKRNQFPKALTQTSDNGFIIAGYTHYAPSGTDHDLILIKLKGDGTYQWAKRYNIKNEKDHAISIIETAPNSYIIGGHLKTAGGNQNIFVMKIAGVEGDTIQWIKTYGTSGEDYLESMGQFDDEFFLTGWSETDSGDVAFILEINDSGNITGKAKHAISNSDKAYKIISTSDGGFGIISTYTNNNDKEFIVLLKYKPDGFDWGKKYGGDAIYIPRDIIQMDDESYVVIGETRNDIDIASPLIIRMDKSGWIKTCSSFTSTINNIFTPGDISVQSQQSDVTVSALDFITNQTSSASEKATSATKENLCE